MRREQILELLFSYRIRQSADVQLSAHTSSCLRNDDVLRMRERAEMTAGTGNTCRSELASVQIPSRKATSGPGAFVLVATPAPQRWHLTSTIPRIKKASHPYQSRLALSFSAKCAHRGSISVFESRSSASISACVPDLPCPCDWTARYNCCTSASPGRTRPIRVASSSAIPISFKK